MRHAKTAKRLDSEFQGILFRRYVAEDFGEIRTEMLTDVGLWAEQESGDAENFPR